MKLTKRCKQATKLLWMVLFFAPIVVFLWLAGFLLGCAYLENPIKSANDLVRNT